MRVWVPLTLAELGEHHAAGVIPPGQDRVVVQEPADEEIEYAALREAAAGSSARYEEIGEQPGRRVVVVAESQDPDAALSLRQVQAVHADVGAHHDADDDLGWYGVQEVPHLLDGGL